MPYIKQENRHTVPDPKTPGELNYYLTSLCVEYWTCFGPNYQAINDVLGALEGAKLEFYRRVTVPFEDKKILENGDVYE